MEEMIKNLVKEAVLEALVEFANYGVATAGDESENTSKKDNDKEGEGKKPVRPKPSLGVGGFSLRN